ncbi:hypothetical protein, partial [Rhizobium rhizoryzae]|uniref:hypothetical protein n=1 Tax=Rhizobium rhizoryzae TaxID=451876 RepID=UPI001AEE1D9A
ALCRGSTDVQYNQAVADARDKPEHDGNVGQALGQQTGNRSSGRFDKAVYGPKQIDKFTPRAAVCSATGEHPLSGKFIFTLSAYILWLWQEGR